MKKLFLTALVALVLGGATDVMAQPRYGRHYGFHRYESVFKGLGMNFGYVHSSSRVRDLYLNEVDKVGGMNGFDVGLTMDFTLIPEALYLQSGLDYVYQMDKPETHDVGFVKLTGKNQDHYLDIPVQLKYAHPLTSKIGVFAQVGPVLSFGMSSKMTYRARLEDGSNAQVIYNYYNGKVKAKGFSDSVEQIVNSQIPDSKFRRFDMRLGGAVGARFFDVLEASIGYQWGVVNKYRGDVAKDYKMRRQQLYVTLGVRF